MSGNVKKVSSIRLRQAVIPRDEKFWEVRWLGRVSADEMHTTVNVVLAQIHDPRDRTINYDSRFTGAEHAANVSVAMLCLMAPGTIWRDGRLFASMHPAAMSKPFTRFCGDPDYHSPVPVLGSHGVWRRQKSTLPHGADESAPCIRMNGDEEVLLLPAVELIRYWFGGTSNLLHLVFLGLLENYVEFSECSLHPELKNTYVLATNFHPTDLEAILLARIAHDPLTRACAITVGDSIKRARAGNMRVYPSVTVPFRGESELNAIVRWSFKPGGGKKTFIGLIERVLSCVTPFPFERIVVAQPEHPRIHLDEDAGGLDIRSRRRLADDLDIEDDQLPDEGLAGLAVLLPDQSLAYPNLASVSVTRTARTPSRLVPGKMLTFRGTTPVGVGTTEVVGEQGTGVRATMVVDDDSVRERAVPPVFEDLFGAVGHIASKGMAAQAVAVSRRALPVAGHPVSFFPQDRALGTEARRWARQGGPNGRRAAVIEINHVGAYHYVVDPEDVEGKGYCIAVFRRHDGAQMAVTELERVLGLCARAKGVWKNEVFDPAVYLHDRLKHMSSLGSAAAYAVAITNKVKQLHRKATRAV